ncbi:thioredoxin-dependent thiol peroxidase [filamentous cyanobacterium LEGE 11480]|uniref:thioredoxin-dependent peroxiredoxin n=1 Tax=Romeriopsis navalis LEGE 11480 TaxID=2777977 RepID=A0A928VUX8_9CYAN|nr:thioredoxin-dependent thiol peroxidase [Romeriopsis navalis]MBE9033040.1 thioredoxin-dependent thiol peroxidase [Romeriopsis navalis LEGE 11480]
MALQIGDQAPDFSVLNEKGETVSLESLQGKWVVLYFYPKDNTPGCNKEACAFRDNFEAFTEKNAVVLGVSLNDAKSHNKFIDKFNLPFSLLIDEDTQLSTAYESYGLKKFMGKEYMGITRNTFLIDPEGKIAKIYKKVKPEPHPIDVLSDLP